MVPCFLIWSLGILKKLNHGVKITRRKVYEKTNYSQRTQILYDMDIGSVSNRLDIKPGDKIVETGTGSGSLSYSLSQ